MQDKPCLAAQKQPDKTSTLLQIQQYLHFKEILRMFIFALSTHAAVATVHLPFVNEMKSCLLAS